MNISFFDDKPNIDELDFKLNILENFKNIKVDDLNHLLFHGIPSSGKTTKIYALLSTIFDKKVYDLKNIKFEEDRKSILYRSSIYHIEINPLNLGSNEKMFISSFLKSYSETKNIGLNIPKIILIKDADKLSKVSQLALRRIIEKNSYTSRFIFEVSNLSNFVEPLISRCLLIRVFLPKIDNIKLCLKNYSIRKGYNINNEEINDIIFESNKINYTYNLKKIFGYFRYYIITKKKFKFLYYDSYYEIINYILQKKISFISLQKIRDIVNEMYINLVSMEELLFFIFNHLSNLYINNNDFLFKLLSLTAECDINLKKGNKDCLHLEYYIISIIELIHN
jgi:DNA polymerase III delta prime subunit